MAVNMFPFCDKSAYQTIYATVGRETNRTRQVRQGSHSAYVKIKMELNLISCQTKIYFDMLRTHTGTLKQSLSTLQIASLYIMLVIFNLQTCLYHTILSQSVKFSFIHVTGISRCLVLFIQKMPGHILSACNRIEFHRVLNYFTIDRRITENHSKRVIRKHLRRRVTLYNRVIKLSDFES